MTTLLYILFFIIFAIWLFREVTSRNLIKQCFNDGNVIVTGLRGRGKDLLFDWVIHSRNKEYISNVDYTKGKNYIVFEGSQIDLGGNRFANFLNNNIIPYEYPFKDGLDYYISDAGVYFPSQENSLLNKYFPSYALFQALSRHLGDCNFHCNCQNLNRLWDKIREQSDCYILMKKTRWHFGFIHVMKGYVYDNYEACKSRVKPMKRRWGRLGRIEYDKFCAQYGEIRKFRITSFRRPSYDSRRFKTILRGEIDEENRRKETSEVSESSS